MALLKASSFVNGYYSIYKVNYLKLIGCSTMIRNFKTNIRLKGTFVERWGEFYALFSFLDENIFPIFFIYREILAKSIDRL